MKRFHKLFELNISFKFPSAIFALFIRDISSYVSFYLVFLRLKYIFQIFKAILGKCLKISCDTFSKWPHFAEEISGNIYLFPKCWTQLAECLNIAGSLKITMAMMQRYAIVVHIHLMIRIIRDLLSGLYLIGSDHCRRYLMLS